MRAIIKTKSGEGHLEFGEWPEPTPAPDEIKLKVGYAGICGTDIHIINGEWPCRPPVVIGHEFCGTAVEVGSLVRGFEPGDRIVASNPAQTCGGCAHCRAGNPFMCGKRVSAGYMIDGAFADYLCIRAERCHRLPDNVSFRQASLGEPLSVAVHAVMERMTVHAGDLVFVSGPGCVGILSMLVAKMEGARVIVAGTAKDKLRLACAQQMGADIVVDISKEDALKVVLENSNGEGADAVCECAGVVESLDLCWEAVRRGGTLMPVGIYPGKIHTDFNRITMKELSVIGSFGYVWTSWQRTIQLLAERRVDTEALISHEFPLSQFDEAFRASSNGTAMKVVFNPEMS